MDFELLKIRELFSQIKNSLGKKEYSYRGKNAKRAEHLDQRFKLKLYNLFHLIKDSYGEIRESEKDEIAQILYELISITASKGYLAEASSLFAYLMSLAPSLKIDEYKVRAGTKMVDDYSLCFDYKLAAETFKSIALLAKEENQKELLECGVDLLKSILDAGGEEDASLLYESLAALAGSSLGQAFLAQATYAMVERLTNIRKFHLAQEYFKKIPQENSPKEILHFRMKASLALAIPLIHQGDFEGLELVKASWNLPDELKEISILKAKAALEFVSDAIAKGVLDEARVAYEAMDEFSNQNSIGYYQILAGVEIVNYLLLYVGPAEAWDFFATLPRHGTHGNNFKALVEPGVQFLVGNLGDMEEMKSTYKFLSELAKTPEDLTLLATSISEQVTFFVKNDYLVEADALYNLYEDDEDKTPGVLDLRIKMGVSLLIMMLKDELMEEAIGIYEKLPEGTKGNKEIKEAKASAQIAIIRYCIENKRFKTAEHFFKKHVDMDLSGILITKLLGVAWGILDNFFDNYKFSKVLSFYDIVLLKFTTKTNRSRETLKVFLDFSKLVICQLAGRGLVSRAKKIYDSLPETSSPYLDEVKLEIAYDIALSYAFYSNFKGALYFFKSIPNKGPSKSHALLKCRIGSYLVEKACANKNIFIARELYKELSALVSSVTKDIFLMVISNETFSSYMSKAVVALVSALCQARKPNMATNYLLTLPSICDVKQHREDLAKAISLIDKDSLLLSDTNSFKLTDFISQYLF
ncbi:MAG: hypothetical protein LBE38_10460 [Deltaproteobacteria bacterium]|jgi:hypothetical protein|nr:hypothetical protein [Deltaproteobacteria bacterium]